MRIPIAAISLLAFSLSNLYAGVGKNSVQQLRVDVGARSVGLGGNQFGSEGSIFSMYYNPALFASMTQQEVGFMHNEYLVDLRQEVFGYIRPTVNRGVFGVGVNYFTYGTIDGYDSTGAKAGDLSAYDLVLNGSWSKLWTFNLGERAIENVASGVSLKIIQKKLADSTAFGFGLDLGFGYPLHFKSQYLDGIKVAFAVQNLSNGIKFDSTASNLPRVIRLGLGQSFFGKAVALGIDGVMVDGGSPYPSVGLEYKLLKMVSIRCGYKGDRKLEKNLTVGIGFENPLFSLDYAFVPGGELEDTHRASVLYRFGKSYEKPKVESQLKEKINYAKTLYAQGALVEAYMISMQINHVAPWLDENNNLLTKIQRGFKELEEGDRREKLAQQIRELFARGEKFFKEGNLVDARLDFQAVLGLEPSHVEAGAYLKQIEGQFQSFAENFYKEGLDAFAAGAYEKAKEQFEKVLVIKPDHAEASAQLTKCMEILETRKKEEQALAQKEASGKIYKDAIVAYSKEQYDDAMSLFAQVMEMDPKREDAQRYYQSCKDNLFKRYFARGQDLAAKGEWEGAIKNLRVALSHNPKSRDARESLSNIQRRWDLQKKVLSQNLYKEGLEAFLSGDKRKAKSSWEKSIELDSDNEEAKRGLARITQ